MRKLIFSILAVLLLVALAVPVKLFLIGEPVDGSTVVCEVQDEGHQLDIFVTTPASAIAFRDNAWLRQEGTELHITLRKVLVSSLYPSGQWSRHLEKEGLTKVYLGGKLIWSE